MVFKQGKLNLRLHREKDDSTTLCKLDGNCTALSQRDSVSVAMAGVLLGAAPAIETPLRRLNQPKAAR